MINCKHGYLPASEFWRVNRILFWIHRPVGFVSQMVSSLAVLDGPYFFHTNHIWVAGIKFYSRFYMVSPGPGEYPYNTARPQTAIIRGIQPYIYGGLLHRGPPYSLDRHIKRSYYFRSQPLSCYSPASLQHLLPSLRLPLLRAYMGPVWHLAMLAPTGRSQCQHSTIPAKAAPSIGSVSMLPLIKSAGMAQRSLPLSLTRPAFRAHPKALLL